MDRKKLKDAFYLAANVLGKLTRTATVTAFGCFLAGLICSTGVDIIDRKEMKNSFKIKK